MWNLVGTEIKKLFSIWSPFSEPTLLVPKVCETSELLPLPRRMQGTGKYLTHPHFVLVDLPWYSGKKHLQTKSALCKGRQSSALQWCSSWKGPCELLRAPAEVKGSWLTKTHTAALKKKKIKFPPQSVECLSVVSTLPWKHVVWFHCLECTRGEPKEW